MLFSADDMLARVLGALPTASAPASSYLNSYPALLALVSDLGSLRRADFIVVAHVVYGWMPTVLQLDVDGVDAVLPLVEEARKGNSLRVDEIKQIAAVVNGSVVGTSKLLHFVNPHCYPIWDSRVFRFLHAGVSGKTVKGHFYQVNDAKAYVNYVHTCQQVIAKPTFAPVYTAVVGKFNRLPAYVQAVITPMRALEYIMFAGAGSERRV